MMMADILEGIVGPVDLQAAAKMHLELTRTGIANTMTNPLVDDPRILHVRYTDFLADPVGTVRPVLRLLRADAEPRGGDGDAYLPEEQSR